MNDQLLAQAAAAKQRRDYAQVVQLLAPLLDNPNPQAEVIACLGFAFFQTKQFVKSVSCWESLLQQTWPSTVEIDLKMNLARAAYMAAQEESQAGRFAQAARLIETFCRTYPGDDRGKALAAKLQRLAHLKEGIVGLEAAKQSMAVSQWSEAADQLLFVRNIMGQTGGTNSAPGN